MPFENWVSPAQSPPDFPDFSIVSGSLSESPLIFFLVFIFLLCFAFIGAHFALSLLDVVRLLSHYEARLKLGHEDYKLKDLVPFLAYLRSVISLVVQSLCNCFASPSAVRMKSNIVSSVKESPLLGLTKRALNRGLVHFSVSQGSILLYLYRLESIQGVLRGNAKCFEKSPILRELAGRVLGEENLLLCSADRHSQVRKYISPAFHWDRLQAFIPTMQQMIREQIKQIQSKIDHSPERCLSIPLISELSAISVRMLLCFLLGEEFLDQYQLLHKEIYENFVRIVDLQQKRSKTGLLSLPLLNWLPVGNEKTIQKLIKRIHQATDGVIQQKRESMKQEREGSAGLAESAADTSVLRLLLECEAEFTAEQVRNELLTLLLAAHDTTPGVIGACITQLALKQNQDKMERVKREIRTVVGDESFVDQTILGGLHYLNGCLSESLRLYPPFPIVRRCIQDTTIPCSDPAIKSPLLIKQGTIAMIHNFALHRIPDYFQDPLQFQPERWIGNDVETLSDSDSSHVDHTKRQQSWKPKSWSYLPFGGGSRTCVGQNFALLQSKLVLIEFLRAFQFEALNEPEPSLALTMKYKGGLPVVIQNTMFHQTNVSNVQK